VALPGAATALALALAPARAQAKLKVATTIETLADLARQVAGSMDPTSSRPGHRWC
jgi:ABC-type Zn uptake system ZnuABC Zn-binding protein ZnuA